MPNGQCVHTAKGFTADEWREKIANQKAMSATHKNPNQTDVKSRVFIGPVVCIIIIGLLYLWGIPLIG